MEALPEDFLSRMRDLETSYTATNDPILQSGFSGGAVRWKEERSPILEAIHESGDLLDVGCANGYLLECLIEWGELKGTTLIPHGVDINPKLIDMATQRLPNSRKNFHVGNAWEWLPPQQYQYVYSVWDCVPESHFDQYCHRLLDKFVKPGGTLILGMYGSRSRNIPPIDLGDHLRSLGFNVAGETIGGNPSVSTFAWIEV